MMQLKKTRKMALSEGRNDMCNRFVVILAYDKRTDGRTDRIGKQYRPLHASAC